MKTREEVEKLMRNWANDPCWNIEDTEGFEDWHSVLWNYRQMKEEEWKAKRDALPINQAKLIMSLFTGKTEQQAQTYALIAIADELIKLNKTIEEFVNRH